MTWTNYQLYNTQTLLGVYRDLLPPVNYWLNLLFPNQMTSTDEYIDFGKIPRVNRKLAPFVVPMAQGRAIYEEGEYLARFKPAYVKASDPVTPNRVLTRRAGTLLAPGNDSPMARYNAIKADIIQYHRNSVERRNEWLAAKAILDGKVVIESDDYPSTLVDFGRAAGQTIVLGSGAYWGTTGVSLYDNIQAWMDLMHIAPFGGAPNRLTVGTSVWAVMRKDAELMANMDTRFRGNSTDVNVGLLPTGEARFVGTLSAQLDVWVYNDFYSVGGTVTPFMSTKDIVLTGPAVTGYQCFGAIMDVHAQFQALPVFIRNYIQDGDVAIEQILTQSAPLMVPVNPNATLKATVLA